MVHVNLYTVEGKKQKIYIKRKTVNDILSTDLDPTYREKGIYLIALTCHKFIVAHIQNDDVKTMPIDKLKMNPRCIIKKDIVYKLLGNFMIVRTESKNDTIVDE